MSGQGEYVCSELTKIGEVTAEVSVYQCGPAYQATWKCSCGGKSELPKHGLTIGSTLENGKADYREHCRNAHRD